MSTGSLNILLMFCNLIPIQHMSLKLPISLESEHSKPVRFIDPSWIDLDSMLQSPCHSKNGILTGWRPFVPKYTTHQR